MATVEPDLGPPGIGHLDRVHAKARLALLHAERDLLERLLDIASKEAAQLLVQLSRTYDDRKRALIIKESADRLNVEVERALLENLERVRDDARDQVQAELEVLKVEELDDEDEADRSQDVAYAAIAALALASAWAQAAASAVFVQDDDEFDEFLAFQVIKQIEFRFRRVATTEVARAWSDEHRQLLEVVADTYDAAAVDYLGNRWDATLDARTCPTCAAHDGEVVPLGEPFSKNDEPGAVHPNCRCISTTVILDVEAYRAVHSHGHARRRAS